MASSRAMQGLCAVFSIQLPQMIIWSMSQYMAEMEALALSDDLSSDATEQSCGSVKYLVDALPVFFRNYPDSSINQRRGQGFQSIYFKQYSKLYPTLFGIQYIISFLTMEY